MLFNFLLYGVISYVAQQVAKNWLVKNKLESEESNVSTFLLVLGLVYIIANFLGRVI